MAVGDAHVSSLLSHTSTNTAFFPKPPTTFLTCFSRGEKRKYAGKKVRLNRVSNSQTTGHESHMLTTEPPVRGHENLCSISTCLGRCWEDYKYNVDFWEQISCKKDESYSEVSCRNLVHPLIL